MIMARNRPDRDPVPLQELIQKPAKGQHVKCSYCERPADAGTFQATEDRDEGGQDVHRRAICGLCFIKMMDRCLRPQVQDPNTGSETGVQP